MKDDVIEFLKKLENYDINSSINELIRSHDKFEKEDIIFFILKETNISKSDETYQWILSELKTIANSN